MESEFESAVRTEETPEAQTVVLDLPAGFRRDDLRVQVNSRGQLVISGERSVKEIEEIKKVGGRLEKTDSGGHRFRKVISVPENVDIEGVTAKLKDQVLRVILPFVQKNQTSPTEDVHGGGKADVANLSEQSKRDEKSSPVKQEDFAHGETPVSTRTQSQAGSHRDQSQIIRSILKPRKKDDKSYLPSPMNKFLEERLQIPSYTICSMMSNRGVLIAATHVLVLFAGMYLSYILWCPK